MVSRKLKFALFGNIYQSRKSANIQKIVELLAERGAEVCMERMFYDFVVDTGMMKPGGVDVFDDSDFTADFVISLGGDGTLLRAAGHVGAKGVPIVGINMGRLGFLADIVPSETESAIDSLYDGNYAIEEHTVISAETDGMPLNGPMLKYYWNRFIEENGLESVPFSNLRRSWRTYMDTDFHIPWNVLEVLMGHKIKGVTGSHYYKPTREQLLSEVCRCISDADGIFKDMKQRFSR